MKKASLAKKRQAKRFGRGAELLANWWLRAKFYSIIERSHAIREGEIDIIARRGEVVAFVEVKARATLEQASQAITREKQRRFNRAARHWLARNPSAANKVLRADAIYIAPWRWPRHAQNAFELDV